MKIIYNKHLCHTEAKVSMLWSLSLFLGHLPRGSDLSIVCKISMLWYFTFFLSLHFLGELHEKDVWHQGMVDAAAATMDAPYPDPF